jgi:hypothetical protein
MAVRGSRWHVYLVVFTAIGALAFLVHTFLDQSGMVNCESSFGVVMTTPKGCAEIHGKSVKASVDAPTAHDSVQSGVFNPARMKSRILSIDLGANLSSTNIDRLEQGLISVVLAYRSDIGDGRAEFDTTKVVRAVLAELLAEGIKPYGQWFIHVSAELVGLKGETGQPLVHPYGTASYNWNGDRIDYRHGL